MFSEEEERDLIQIEVRSQHVRIDGEKVECLCFLYACVFKTISKMLELEEPDKDSIERMKNALEKIHSKLIDLKTNKIEKRDRRYKNIRDISRPLISLQAQLKAMFSIFDLAFSSDPEPEPGTLSRSYTALILFTESLGKCREDIGEINKHTKSWCDEKLLQVCQDKKDNRHTA